MQFSIVSANLLNLAVSNQRFYANHEGYTSQTYRAKVARLASILDPINADIIAVQEVWDKPALVDLAERLGFRSSDVFCPLAEPLTESVRNSLTRAQPNNAQLDPLAPLDNGRLIGTPAVGFISRFDVVSVQPLYEIPIRSQISIPDVGVYQFFARPPLKVKVKLGENLLTIIVTHLKSKRPYFLRDSDGELLEDQQDATIRVRAKLRSLCMRGAEAAGIRHYLSDILTHTQDPVIVLGDMNDVAHSVTTMLLAETNEVRYDKGFRDTALFNSLDIQDDIGLTSQSYTHIYQGMPEVIDHILVSEEFLSDSKYSIGRVKSVDYFNDHLRLDYEEQGTDHGIVRAILQLNS